MNKYALPRSATSALALGAALLVAPLALSQESEEVFELSPFTVEGADDRGYRAASTLAGTRIRTDLKDVGSAISVVTEEFLRDTSATDNESLLVYTTGTEVGGIQGNFAGGGDGGRVDTDAQRLRPNQATRVRGLAAADNTRDFFVTDIPWDSYNVDRIDLQRGPNSVLFGLGSPAGVINATTNSANFEDGGSVEGRFGSYDSYRVTVDYNKVILEDQLAIRVSALHEDQKYRQEGAFEEDNRYYVAFKYQPYFLQGEGSSTILQGSYERGDIDANRPRVIPPIDRITPWFNSMNKATYDSQTVDDAGGVLDSNSPNFQPYLASTVGRIFDGPVAYYDGGANPAGYFMAQLPDGRIRGIDGYDGYAKTANLPASDIGVYKSITLSDPSIFDFYNNLLDGPNKSEWQEWDAYNLSLSHTLLDNKLGFEIMLDEQYYEDGQTNVFDNAGQALSIDVMATLPDGSPNPNVGRPIVGGDAQNNWRNWRDRSSFRFTAFYDVDFRDRNSDTLGSILGRHVFTGVYSKYEYTQLTHNWIRATAENINPGSDITQANRYVANLVYLGPSLADRSSASGAYIPSVQQRLVPTNGTIVTQEEEGAPFVSGPINLWSADAGDINNLYKGGNFARNTTDSKAFVWQGYLFDGMVVPVFGYREDTDAAGNAGNIPNHPSITGAKIVNDPDWTVPNSTTETDVAANKTYATASGINRTFSLVVHSPKAVRDALGGFNVSLTYSDSENFRPDASRRDLIGNPIAPTTGETTEYGIVISSPENRFNFKINKYETKVYQDTLSAASIANSYMIGAGEGWGRMFAEWARHGAHDFSQNYALVEPTDPESGINEAAALAGITDLRYQPTLNDSMTLEQQAAAYQAALDLQNAAIGAMFNDANNLGDPTFVQFMNFWKQDWANINYEDGWGDGGLAWAGEPSTFAITGDTISKGYEYELYFQPANNWNITLNASKTNATRLNIAESYATWVEDRWQLYQGPYGDVRLWGGAATTETIRGKFGSEFYSNYTLFRLLNGSNVAELRPWRANLVTNYMFDDGVLGGVNVGGAVRWQDSVVIGYPVLGNETDGYTFDVDNPYEGGSETDVDLWLGYQRSLTDNIDWRIQLNVKNAFGSKELIPITVQPDGTPATSRIKEGTTWTLSNTFSF